MARIAAILICLGSVLLCASCRTRPGPVSSQARLDLDADSVGFIRAGDYGWAELQRARLSDSLVKGNAPWFLFAVSAAQEQAGAHYALSAQLRLKYRWQGKDWQLDAVETVKPWTRRLIRTEAELRQQEEAGGDSGAIQNLLRTRRVVQRQLNDLPVMP